MTIPDQPFTGCGAEVAHRIGSRPRWVKNVSALGLLHNCLRITVGTAAENERCAAALGAALCL